MQNAKKKSIYELEYKVQNYDIGLEGVKFKAGHDLKEIYENCKANLKKSDKPLKISGLEGYLKEIKKNISTED